jgi:hypothetical protein
MSDRLAPTVTRSIRSAAERALNSELAGTGTFLTPVLGHGRRATRRAQTGTRLTLTVKVL